LGGAIAARLVAEGHAVLALSRSSPESNRRRSSLEGVHWVRGDPARPGPWLDEISGVDGIVHLAGEPIAGGGWTSARKRRLVESRVESTGLLASTIQRAATPPEFFVCASAVGYYGDQGAEALSEDHEPGHDFLARLSVEWEHAAARAGKGNTRVVLLRIGVVLAADGGALVPMARAFRLGLGGPLGTGRQYFPWVHIQDLVRIILFALDNEQVRGPVNAVAPDPPRQKDFAACLGRALGRRSWLPTPGPVLYMVLGGKAEMILASQRAVPTVLRAQGFHFTWGEMEPALADLFPA